jgi:hypothetical protein
MSTLELEEKFIAWSKPPSETEENKIKNTIRAIRNALDASEELKSTTKVYVQGSYRNRVNVRQESDVDIGVLYTGDSFWGHYPEGTTAETFGLGKGDKDFGEFKDELEKALVSWFGKGAVNRGNKAIDVHENTYRIDADVVAQFEHRRYNINGTYLTGIQFYTDNGEAIVNWPEQHYENGVQKNTDTSMNYKGVVRIIKKLRCILEDQNVASAKPINGFLIESLVWNVPSDYFTGSSWCAIVRKVLAHIWYATKSIENCIEWAEVNDLKYLFRGSPDSKRQQAYNFIDEVWDYVGVAE